MDLTRLLVNEGHEVTIILTKGALNFVIPEVFSYLGAKEVYKADGDFRKSGVLHVELGKSVDKFIIAPLSANTLANLVNGSASDLLTSTFLAYPKNKPILVFPAMNSEMLTHPFVEFNFNEIKKLKSLNNIFVSETDSGVLACNAIGSGKLPPIDEIFHLIETVNLDLPKKNKIVITTGATISPLDPVRFMTNASTGITGFYLAKTFLEKGYLVTVIAGENSASELNMILKHPNYKLVRIKTAEQMLSHCRNEINDAQVFIASAAVSDFNFNYTNSKIKKDQINSELKITPAVDVLKTIISEKKDHLKIVGFAAETELTEEVLRKKYIGKPVDLLVGTKVHSGFQQDETIGFKKLNASYALMKNEQIIISQEIDKKNLGDIILKNLNL
jgi:phosphopantothenoylcysteine decarboxylase/phosphopantothenate--cysteine ligase